MVGYDYSGSKSERKVVGAVLLTAMGFFVPTKSKLHDGYKRRCYMVVRHVMSMRRALETGKK